FAGRTGRDHDAAGLVLRDMIAEKILSFRGAQEIHCYRVGLSGVTLDLGLHLPEIDHSGHVAAAVAEIDAGFHGCALLAAPSSRTISAVTMGTAASTASVRPSRMVDKSPASTAHTRTDFGTRAPTMRPNCSASDRLPSWVVQVFLVAPAASRPKQ